MIKRLMALKKVPYPSSTVTVIASWLKMNLDIVCMADSVNSLLHRNKYGCGKEIANAK